MVKKKEVKVKSKDQKYNLFKINLIILIVLLVLVLYFFLHVKPTIIGNAGGVIGVDFASPIAAFQLDKTSMTFAALSETQTLLVSTNDNKVYKNAYYSTGTTWNKFQLSGTTLSSGWITGAASKTLSLKASDLNLNDTNLSKTLHVITYSCTKLSRNKFDCRNNLWQIKDINVIYQPQVTQTATPVASPVAGTYTSAQSVTLSSATSGASIYYTIDGIDPTTTSTLYSGAISISATTTLKAIAVKSGYTNSSVLSASYTINIPSLVATPVASPVAGTYTSVQSITLSSATSGASIYYTINGVDPTTSSTLYSGAISISATTTLKAIAVNSGYANSSILTSVYTINSGIDLTPPTITSFVIPTTSTSLNVPITTLVATDNTSVTGYKLTETSTVPSASASGWSATAPTTYAFTNTGEKTLYAWAKDVAGNVSTSLNLKVMIAYHFYYLSPSGNDNTGSGTISSPWFTIEKAWNKPVVAGDVIYMMGGTYAYASTQNLDSKNGTAENLIRILAYPNDPNGVPKITRITPYTSFEYSGGILNGWPVGLYITNISYVQFKGLEIKGFTQETTDLWGGVRAENVNNCIFELLNIHDNGSGMIIAYDSANNLVLNSDFHHNQDPLTLSGAYGNADGLDLGNTTGNAVNGTNTIRGCRAWWNSDDGFDAWANDGILIIENSWAFWNGYLPGGFISGGNGEGFKLGSDTMLQTPTVLKRILTNCVAFENKNNGFAANNAPCKVKALNCTAYHNAQNGVAYIVGFKLDSTTNAGHIITNCISYNNVWYSQTPNDRPVYLDATSIVTTSTFIVTRYLNPAFTVTDTDFISLDSTGMDGPRKADGSLPDTNFLHLATGSDLINAGTIVGLPYNGAAPDLGAFEK